MRFDFSFGRKVTKEELAQVEAIVNEAIQKNIDVILEEMTPEEKNKYYEERLEELEAENAYLKKLRALVQKKQDQQRKKE